MKLSTFSYVHWSFQYFSKEVAVEIFCHFFLLNSLPLFYEGLKNMYIVDTSCFCPHTLPSVLGIEPRALWLLRKCSITWDILLALYNCLNFIFEIGSCWLWLGWPQTRNPPTSASQEAGITVVYQYAQIQVVSWCFVLGFPETVPEMGI
jgi:hypothetical protein